MYIIVNSSRKENHFSYLLLLDLLLIRCLINDNYESNITKNSNYQFLLIKG